MRFTVLGGEPGACTGVLAVVLRGFGDGVRGRPATARDGRRRDVHPQAQQQGKDGGA